MRAAIQGPVSNLVSASRGWVWLPGWGVVVFAMLYAIASSVYSAGVGSEYNHLTNYWCDLLASTSRAGLPNQARPFALLGTCLLPLSLLPLWFNIPVLFVRGSRRAMAVRVTGAIAMFCSTLIWTSLHDVALNVVALFGFVALITTLFSIDPQRHRVVLLTAALAGALALTNYALWATGSWAWAIPAVQKLAFLGVFAWVGVASAAIAREIRGER